ncbi:MAG: class I SAM-dependent methyltransferase [Gemmatimonadota bacterium]|nr:MAG: class I SAM-dependent methyltransferase [Gemmatimonadota bacterium]
MRTRHCSPTLPRLHRSLLIILLAAGFLPAQLQAQRGNRDAWQRVPDVIAALAIAEGSSVADVGAGSGYFTEHLAREVGPSGRVYAVDISERALSQLRELANDEGFENVEVVRGEVDDPKLPEESLDAVLVVDAYHEMTEYSAMLAGMYRSLKPGGRLVMLDHVPSDTSLSRSRQTANHDLSSRLAEREVEAAGFEVLRRDDRFAEMRRNQWQWILVARR